MNKDGTLWKNFINSMLCVRFGRLIELTFLRFFVYKTKNIRFAIQHKRRHPIRSRLKTKPSHFEN